MGEQILQALADVTRVTVLRLPSLYGADKRIVLLTAWRGRRYAMNQLNCFRVAN
jgi:hypothetical protein